MQTLPKVGEPTMVAGISFPLTLLSINENTHTASLGGQHPESGAEVLLSKVCLDFLCPVEPAIVLAIGQYARLKSGGPLMTIVDIQPPLPDMPADMGIMVTCWHFRNNGKLLRLELDVRSLNISDSSCAV